MPISLSFNTTKGYFVGLLLLGLTVKGTLWPPRINLNVDLLFGMGNDNTIHTTIILHVADVSA